MIIKPGKKGYWKYNVETQQCHNYGNIRNRRPMKFPPIIGIGNKLLTPYRVLGRGHLKSRRPVWERNPVLK